MIVIIMFMVMQRMLVITIMLVIISSHDQHLSTDGNAKGAMMIMVVDFWWC